MRKLRVLVADDHPLLANGLIRALKSMNFIEHVSHVNNGQEAINFCLDNHVDVVFMDYSMPLMNGYDASELMINKFQFKAKIIILSAYASKAIVESFLKIGVNGYLTKTEGPEHLEAAIRSATCGDVYLCEKAESFVDRNVRNFENTLPLSFTNRELDIIRQLVKGNTNAQIAQNLKLTKRTVDTYRLNLVSKVRAKNTAELIQYVYANKIIDG